MTSSRLLQVLVAYLIATTGGLFVYNLPAWCMNPDMTGYWVIESLCK